MEQRASEYKNAKDLVQKKSSKDKTRKIVIGIIVGSILTILTIITLLVYLVVRILAGETTSSTDVADYQYIFELSNNSGLNIFPEEITSDMSDIDFRYQETVYFVGTPLASAFLQTTYTPDAYVAEVKRLESIRKVYGGTEKTALRDVENRYPYPAYITVDNHLNQYEYALLTGENQITYIYTCIYGAEDVGFATEYLPVDYMVPQEEWGAGYSIYIKHFDNSGGISYDTTRDEYVEVSYGHIEMIESSYFTVRVELDNQNRELIQQCEFRYYEDPKDINDVRTYDYESDDTYWEDLKGFQFVDLELSKDRTTAIVTYLDNGEEKQWQMELTQYMKAQEE